MGLWGKYLRVGERREREGARGRERWYKMNLVIRVHQIIMMMPINSTMWLGKGEGQRMGKSIVYHTCW
jgi:hypothetical protein